jgi:hypothetical protein
MEMASPISLIQLYIIMVFRKTMKAFLLLSLVSCAQSVIGQKNYTISGIIKSKNTGEYIIGASVKVLNTNYGTTSNEYGFYSISLVPNNYQIIYSALGKTPDTITINLGGNVEKNIALLDADYELANVTVTSSKHLVDPLLDHKWVLKNSQFKKLKIFQSYLGRKIY